MKINRLCLATAIGAAVLLAGCGGGDGDGSSPTTTATGNTSTSNNGSTGTATDTTSTDQTTTFKCPSGYKSIQLTKSTIPNATMTLVTDDGVATYTFKTPQDGVVRDGTVCLGKPDPVPAGVQADVIYEIKTYGGFYEMSDRKLTLNFTSNLIPDPSPPVIELADVSSGTVTYKPAIQGNLISTPPNFSLSVYPNAPGLYVVRLKR
ncbi:hypothetical protein LGM63_10030 [Burkholderia cepacia]|uniref:hypothetical protein n=1 Tax=Burkholderia TaxID=32008 RepID=UPI000759210D|nr:hypothetical protein [Burkholderia cepacia]KVA62696.1 hypothetical protein WI49_02190 [Burkholderia cepacia]KVA65560.1 hypothetical protein WI48_37170 [Burkholderia cepacia]KVA78191.1 hypothetical protein WI50_30645 [Burkholderia cepacia]KVA83931.1 hypothetical protein WI51_22335 [Burkholderia cepacia]KVA98421.1 hypothetical protein WI52_29780 [Burkholderia cepacia]